TAVLLDVACHGKLLSLGLFDTPTVRSGGQAAGSGLIRRRGIARPAQAQRGRRGTPADHPRMGPKGLEAGARPIRIRRHRRDQSMRKGGAAGTATMHEGTGALPPVTAADAAVIS